MAIVKITQFGHTSEFDTDSLIEVPVEPTPQQLTVWIVIKKDSPFIIGCFYSRDKAVNYINGSDSLAVIGLPVL